MIPVLTEEVEDVATEAVRRLDVEGFISKNLDSLYEKFEEADRTAPAGDDIAFVALSEPTVKMIINFASGRKDLLDAMSWVREQWKDKTRDPDALAILSMLTLLYIVRKGIKHGDPARRETWRRFSERLSSLKEQADKAPARE
jgi:hypothetical protein